MSRGPDALFIETLWLPEHMSLVAAMKD